MYQDGQPYSGQSSPEVEDQRISDRENALWARFAEANSVEHFCHSWLAIQCRTITGVRGALVLLGPANTGPFTPAAVWPDVRKNMEYLSGVAERALSERRGLLVKNSNDESQDERIQQGYHVAYPLEVDKQLHGVIVLDVSPRSEAELQSVLRELHWGSAWLEVLLRREQSQSQTDARDRLITVLELVASSVEQKRFFASALEFVTELAGHYSCHRVSLGFLKKHKAEVQAISYSAKFDKKSELANAIADCMNEAIDQQSIVIYPTAENDPDPVVNIAHGQLAQLDETASICTLPLYHAGKITGAVTLERAANNKFDTDTVDVLNAVCAMAAPILKEKHVNDRLIISKNITSLKNFISKFTGSEHMAFKLISGIAGILLAFIIFVSGDYRVTADTVIEGKIQRVITTSFASYVVEAEARAGDIVKEGQVLAILDDKDLELERLKYASQKSQYQRQYREAMAEHDRAKIRIIMAQLEQTNAQLSLINYQLSRIKIKAPFKGILVSGDLSQSLGAPVEKGQTLFEIAPLDAYRVILKIDERDINEVKVGQTGKLTLSSLPEDEFSFSVEKITPISTPDEGRNYFRVEAKLEGASDRLRPGMEGVGKVSIESRKLIWIWTHSLIDWFRLWIWSWWP